MQTRSQTRSKQRLAMPGEAPTTTTTTTTIVVTVPPPTKTQKAAARRKEAYQQQVAGWRHNKCLLVLGGMGFKAATDEFERDCRAKLAHDIPGVVVQFAWMPHKRPTRNHQGKVAVGFESAAQRTAAEWALAHWVWRIHPIHMEGVNMKKVPRSPDGWNGWYRRLTGSTVKVPQETGDD